MLNIKKTEVKTRNIMNQKST